MLYHHSHQTQRHPLGASVFGYVVRDSKPGEQNGPVERFARPGSESSPGAQHGVQAAVCSSLFNTPYMLYTNTVNKPKTPFLPLSVDQLIRQSPKYAIQSTPDI